MQLQIKEARGAFARRASVVHCGRGQWWLFQVAPAALLFLIVAQSETQASYASAWSALATQLSTICPRRVASSTIHSHSACAARCRPSFFSSQNCLLLVAPAETSWPPSARTLSAKVLM